MSLAAPGKDRPTKRNLSLLSPPTLPLVTNTTTLATRERKTLPSGTTLIPSVSHANVPSPPEIWGWKEVPSGALFLVRDRLSSPFLLYCVHSRR